MQVVMHRVIGDADYRGMLRNFGHLRAKWNINVEAASTENEFTQQLSCD
jgi:hypothetical protein